jgi:leishmanolysin-like peptidase
MDFTTDAPTSSPTSGEDSSWFIDLFKSREHEENLASVTDDNVDAMTLSVDDDEITGEPVSRRNLATESLDSLYQTDLDANERGNAHQQLPLPNKQCEPWLPSIVPRQRTVSDTWEGASPDPSSRASSSMAISRPRKLYPTFLQARAIADQLHLRESWITSSVPVNIPKFEARQQGSEFRDIPLTIPDMTYETTRKYKTLVNYGSKLPIEAAQNESHGSSKPLRITFVTDGLLDNGDLGESDIAATVAKIESITGDILPNIAELYAAALSVVPSLDNMFPVSASSRTDKCGEALFPSLHLKDGVPNTDTLIYVTLNGPKCSDGVTAYASVCLFDQHMRPLTGNLVICLNEIQSSPRGEFTEKETLRLSASLTMQVGKILGLSTSLFQYYINPETGKPRGTTKKKVTCVNGDVREIDVPNIVMQRSESDEHGRGGSAYPSFLITSPTVRQVVRNHFDCQTLSGAHLDRNPSSCFGEVLDSRYHFDEDMSEFGSFADMAYSLSPLTLALLEDSSWYKADFSKASVPLFGRGAGCGFVEGECVSKSYSVPDYSKDFFCGDVVDGDILFGRKPSSCDFSHNHKADCEVLNGVSMMQGSSKANTQCPMRTGNIVSCSDSFSSGDMKGEVYSVNSRCFDTNTPTSVCLQSYCNSIDMKIDIVVEGKVHQCDYEGQEVNLGDYSIFCPRLAVICPHLVCPSNCSGRGVCDYCRLVPQCICDNPFDKSSGCWDS